MDDYIKLMMLIVVLLIGAGAQWALWLIFFAPQPGESVPLWSVVHFSEMSARKYIGILLAGVVVFAVVKTRSDEQIDEDEGGLILREFVLFNLYLGSLVLLATKGGLGFGDIISQLKDAIREIVSF